MNLELTGKVAMVAGASRGLGFAVARALAKEGVQVSISSRKAEAAEAAAKKIEHDTGRHILAMAVDVRSAEAIAQWHKATLDRWGGIDLLYPNSGGPPPGPALKFDDAAWQNAFELLLLSAVRMIQAPMGTIKPLDSATGTKAVGRTRPSLGWFQRNKASNPVSRPVARSSSG